jgi:hypothetical protein
MVRNVPVRVRRVVLDEGNLPAVASIVGHPGRDSAESGSIGWITCGCQSEKQSCQTCSLEQERHVVETGRVE